MSRPALAWLAPGRTVGLLILCYLAAHLAVRLLTSPTLGIDDAEQALLVQRFAWGYQLRQPPLYGWLLLATFHLVGVNLLALSLVRYLLLGVTFFGIYGVARRWIRDPRLAALAVLSYTAIYLFGYYGHHDLTHTTALSALIAASLYVFARLVEQPTAGRYLLLGACFGLGMLAKWNFVMLAVGLPLACLFDPRLRVLVLDRRLLLALAATALVAAPSALWVLAQQASVGAAASAVLVDQPGRSFASTLAVGTATLARATLAYPMPFLVLFLLTFGSALWRARGAPDPEQEPSDRPQVTPGFLGRLVVLILALHWLLIPTARAVAFTEHWMHPAMMVLPVLLFALAVRGRPTPLALRSYLCLLGLVVALALGARVGHYALGADHCGRCRDLVPFAALAGELRTAGFARGTIVVDDLHVGGNLRLAFTGNRVLDPAFPATIWPPPGDHGQCLAVWQADLPHPSAHRRRLEAWLARQLQVAPDAARISGRVAAPMIGSRTKLYALEYELWPQGAGTCR